MKFHITKDIEDLGLKVVTVQMTDIKNFKSSPELDTYIAKEVENIKNTWTWKSYKGSIVLQGFRELHTKVGRSNRDYPASPEVLLRLLLEKNRFPRINAVVDIYNLISLKSQLALGAHDSSHINGSVTLRFTKGNELFIPLGKTEAVSILAGEYAYVDDANNIICRMEVLQCDNTKITVTSRDIFLIIQGNKNTDFSFIQKTTKNLIDLLQNFCDGGYTFL